MEKEFYKNLKSSFDSDFTDRVMNRVEAEVKKGVSPKQHRFTTRLVRFSISAAAASVLLFVGINFNNLKNNGLDGVMGLSEYSDYELSQMDYFTEESNE